MGGCVVGDIGGGVGIVVVGGNVSFVTLKHGPPLLLFVATVSDLPPEEQMRLK
jgi:hypothetical protein